MNIKKVLTSTFIMSFSILLAINNEISTINASNITFDYSNPNSQSTKILSSEEVIELIIKEEISLVESEFLSSYDSVLKYEDKIPNGNVLTSLNDNTLTIQAETYTYIDINGNQITWIPFDVTLQDITKNFEFSEQVYECVFENVLDESESFNITYYTELKLDKDNVNMLINKAYNVAEYYVTNNIIEQETQKYESEYKQYELDVEKYNQYLLDLQQYDIDYQKYQEYLNEKAIYDDKKAKYDEYLIECETYQNELLAYNQYLLDLQQYDIDYQKYQEYLNEKIIYDEEYSLYLQEYEKYASYMEIVNYQLASMELIKTPMTSLKRDVYSAIMGDSVTKVLANKEALKIAGVPGDVIDDANNATINLKELLPGYFSCETDADKYAYYKKNYRLIKENFETLLRSLDLLFRTPVVLLGIDAKFPEYKEKLVILIAQLALVCNAIDDNDVLTYEGNYDTSDSSSVLYFDSSWKVNDKTLAEVLENEYDLSCTYGKAYPLPIGYPLEPEAPESLEVVTKPILPKEVLKPVEPTIVEDPGEEPDIVIQPVVPLQVAKPIEPTPYVVDSSIQNLIDAYNNNELSYRTEYDNDVDIILKTSFIKKFKNQEIVTIEFRDLDDSILGKYETDVNSYIVYENDLPFKNPDEVYSVYEFSHWQYLDGEILDLENVTKEGIVYPVFVGSKLQQYTITWLIDDIEYTESYEYGSIPYYKDKIYKPYNGNYYYTFDSWDKEIVNVTGNKTYVALFNENYLITEGENNANIFYYSDLIVIDISSFDSFSINMDEFLSEVVLEDKAYNIKIVYGNNSILMNLSTIETTYLLNKQLSKIEVIKSQDRKYEYTYLVNLYNKNDELIDNDLQISIEFSGEYDKNRSTLYLVDDENTLTEIRSTIKSNKITAKITTNKKYVLYPLYKITVYTNDYINIKINKEVAKYGNIIRYETLCKEGIEISKIHVTYANGTPIECIDNEFEMPASDVYIIVEYKFINYVINFYVDDQIISSKTYKYGDSVTIPSTPIKESDEDYSYTFIGWDKVVSEVTENTNYYAIFDKTELIKKEPVEKNNNSLIAKIIIFSSVGVVSIVLMLLFIFKKKIIFKR